MRVVIGILLVLSLGACALENKPHRRAATSIWDPVCAPDGSVVRVEYANEQGTYKGIKTSKENCLWNKKK